MEVEQDVYAGSRRGAHRLQHRRWLGIVLLRAAQTNVEPAQTLRDSPLKYGRMRSGREPGRQRGDQGERARLVASLDDDQRHAAFQQRFQLFARVDRGCHGVNLQVNPVGSFARKRSSEALRRTCCSWRVANFFPPGD
jgi:hypothetical protein